MFLVPNFHKSDAIIAIDDCKNVFTFEDLSKLSLEIKNVVASRKLIFCLSTNSFASLGGYLSFLNHRIVPLMVDAGIDIDLLKNLLHIYKPNYLWLPNERLADFSSLSIVYSSHNYSLVTYCQDAVNLNEDLALLLTTSGSTGSPKLVRLTYKNIMSNAESITEYLQLSKEERPVTSLPMYYSYGLSVINSHVLVGATLLLTNKSVLQKEFWEFVKSEKATSIAGVPYTYEMLKRLRLLVMDIPQLRTMTQAGGKLAPDLVKEYVEQATAAGKRFIVMYGQTEATARMSYLPFDHALEKHSSIGIAIPRGKFMLRDADGDEIIGSDKDGELVYIGANVSMGYAECREDLAKGDENKGILYTGDIAHRDNEGFYYITGRIARFVKIFGIRVNLDMVEQLIKPITTPCACIGNDDQMTIFITEPGKEEEIKELLINKTGIHIRAFTIKVINHIPKNLSGKIQYAELSKLNDQ